LNLSLPSQTGESKGVSVSTFNGMRKLCILEAFPRRRREKNNHGGEERKIMPRGNRGEKNVIFTETGRRQGGMLKRSFDKEGKGKFNAGNSRDMHYSLILF